MPKIFALSRTWRPMTLSSAVLLLGTLLTIGPAAADPTKLSFFSWDGQQTMQPVIDEFEKENPGIKIDFSTAPPVTEYESTLQTRLLVVF